MIFINEPHIITKKNIEHRLEKNQKNIINIDDKNISEKTEINFQEIKFRKIFLNANLEKIKTPFGNFIYQIKLEYGIGNKKDFFNFYVILKTKNEGKQKWTQETINLKQNGTETLNPYFNNDSVGEIEIEIWAHTFHFWEWQQRKNILCSKLSFKIEKKNIQNEKIIMNEYDQIKLIKTSNYIINIDKTGKNVTKKQSTTLLGINNNLSNKIHNNFIFLIDYILEKKDLNIKKAILKNWGTNSNKEIILDKENLEIESHTFYDDKSSIVLEGIGSYSKKGLLISPKFSGFIFPELFLEFEDSSVKLNIHGRIEIKTKLLDKDNGLINLESIESKTVAVDEEQKDFIFFDPNAVSQITRASNLSFSKLKEWALKDEN